MPTISPHVADVLDRRFEHGSILERQESRLRLHDQAAKQIFTTADAEKRGLSNQEDRDLKVLTERIKEIKERVEELRDEDRREHAAAAVRKAQWSVSGDAGTYRKGDPTSPSWFADRARAVRGDSQAASRLHRGAQESMVDMAAAPELRAMNTSPGSGGEFAPPAWLVSDYIALARAGRPVADSVNNKPLPSGVSSVNIPDVLTGTTTAQQSIQNTAVSNTDPATGAVSDGVHTIAGFVVISQQDIDQTPINFDEVILSDLAADYSKQLDSAVIAKMVSAGTATTYTDASPSTVKVNQRVAAAITSIHRQRHAPPTHIAMSPERWSNFTTYTDSAGRPLIVPSAAGPMNAFGSSGSPTSEGNAGGLQGLTVAVDAEIPVNLGAGNNQDEMMIYRADDTWLFESMPTAEAMPQTYGNQLSVLCRFYRYYACLVRYGTSIAVITGSGMIPPPLGS